MPESDSIPPVQYRPIPGFPGYRVGDDGSVWSSRPGKGNWLANSRGEWRQLKLTERPRGNTTYQAVFLRRSLAAGPTVTCYVHRLVLMGFVGPCPPGHVACHFPDPNGCNNRLVNLRWDTHRANVEDCRLHGNLRVGDRSPRSILREEDIPEIRRLAGEGASFVDLGERYGVSRGAIRMAVYQKTWGHVDAPSPGFRQDSAPFVAEFMDDDSWCVHRRDGSSFLAVFHGPHRIEHAREYASFKNHRRQRLENGPTGRRRGRRQAK